MKLLRAADHRRMPWKNGGGETLEIAVSPADAGIDGFDWRVSMAVVAADGPFSIFPGIDRTLVLLEGGGMLLDIVGRGRVTLTTDSPPLAFPADVAVQAWLGAGPITDFNVMTARGRYVHDVRRFAAPRDIRPAPSETAALLGDGMTIQMAGQTVTLGPRDVALIEAGEAAWAGPAGLLATIGRTT